MSLEQTIKNLGLKEKQALVIRELIYAMDISPMQFQRDAVLFYANRVMENPSAVGFTLCNKLKEMLNDQDET